MYGHNERRGIFVKKCSGIHTEECDLEALICLNCNLKLSQLDNKEHADRINELEEKLGDNSYNDKMAIMCLYCLTKKGAICCECKEDVVKQAQLEIIEKIEKEAEVMGWMKDSKPFPMLTIPNDVFKHIKKGVFNGNI